MQYIYSLHVVYLYSPFYWFICKYKVVRDSSDVMHLIKIYNTTQCQSSSSNNLIFSIYLAEMEVLLLTIQGTLTPELHHPQKLFLTLNKPTQPITLQQITSTTLPLQQTTMAVQVAAKIRFMTFLATMTI